MHYQPKCQHQRHATQLCVSRGCQIKNVFCCAQCKRVHPKTCEFMEYKKFILEMHRRQGLRKQQFCRYQQRVQNTFNLLIKALKAEFIQFREQYQRFNATEQIVQFYNSIRDHKQKQTTGQQVRQLLDLQIPRMQDYRIRDQIEMKRIQNNILTAHSYVIEKLKPYYALRQKFQEIQVQVPQINQLKAIEDKYIDRGKTKDGLLKGDLRYFQSLLGHKIYNIQMLYRASENQFSCTKFHQKCDGKRRTLVMAKTQFGKTIGLWCPFEWSSPAKWIYIDSMADGAFMFSMEKQLKGMKFEPVKTEYSIGLHKDYGPIFGDDFVIYDKANLSKSCWSNFPDVYNIKDKPLQHSLEALEAFAGVQDHFKKFNLVEWQVYKISFNRSQDLEASWMKIYNNV